MSKDQEDIFLCLGCQRKEMHKKCPAHGTIFYMSGIHYSEQIEALRNLIEELDYDLYKEIFVCSEELTEKEAFRRIAKLELIAYKHLLPNLSMRA